MSVCLTDLANLLQNEEYVWVRLTDGMRIAIIAVHNLDTGILVGKFIPCANNSRSYTIKLKEVREIIPKKED